jgi:ABC-type lipoprotein release transport system permease subunit
LHQEGVVSAQFNTIGFTVSRQRRRQRRSVMLAQLIATVALIVSIAVVVTAVSIGFARAGAPVEAASGGPLPR